MVQVKVEPGAAAWWCGKMRGKCAVRTTQDSGFVEWQEARTGRNRLRTSRAICATLSTPSVVLPCYPPRCSKKCRPRESALYRRGRGSYAAHVGERAADRQVSDRHRSQPCRLIPISRLLRRRHCCVLPARVRALPGALLPHAMLVAVLPRYTLPPPPLRRVAPRAFTNARYNAL